jgi:hypothetical protein
LFGTVGNDVAGQIQLWGRVEELGVAASQEDADLRRRDRAEAFVSAGYQRSVHFRKLL